MFLSWKCILNNGESGKTLRFLVFLNSSLPQISDPEWKVTGHFRTGRQRKSAILVTTSAFVDFWIIVHSTFKKILHCISIYPSDLNFVFSSHYFEKINVVFLKVHEKWTSGKTGKTLLPPPLLLSVNYTDLKDSNYFKLAIFARKIKKINKN